MLELETVPRWIASYLRLRSLSVGREGNRKTDKNERPPFHWYPEQRVSVAPTRLTQRTVQRVANKPIRDGCQQKDSGSDIRPMVEVYKNSKRQQQTMRWPKVGTQARPTRSK